MTGVYTVLNHSRICETIKAMDLQKLIIIDDDVENLSVLEEFLSQRYSVCIASDPELGIQKIKDFKPDFIILDIDMPGMNGFEVCENIRAESGFKNTPILFLSAKTRADNIHEALRLGANDFINKPFRLKELLRRIEMRLGQAESDAPINCGNLTLDASRSVVIIKTGKEKTLDIQLTTKAISVLALLIKSAGRVVSREHIIDKILGGEDTSDRAVDLHIHRIKTQLVGWNREIKSVYGKGYCVVPKEK